MIESQIVCSLRLRPTYTGEKCLTPRFTMPVPRGRTLEKSLIHSMSGITVHHLVYVESVPRK